MDNVKFINGHKYMSSSQFLYNTKEEAKLQAFEAKHQFRDAVYKNKDQNTKFG